MVIYTFYINTYTAKLTKVVAWPIKTTGREARKYVGHKPKQTLETNLDILYLHFTKEFFGFVTKIKSIEIDNKLSPGTHRVPITPRQIGPYM